MYFNEEEFNRVESATLNGKKFNPIQREFIELMKSRFIIAGPGVGKTTSLSAKIVLLLLSLMKNGLNESICVITKTNVAVDEINRILKNVGQPKMKHPHFVGTVHSFFNTYLATPYIQKELKPKRIQFGKESDYLTILNELAEKHPYFRNWNEGARNATVRRVSNSKLIFNKLKNQFELENSTEWESFEQHGRHMFTLKWNLKKIGCFSFNDTFLFSTAAMINEKIISLLRKRFKYVFIDEFQDTDKSSIELINQIFNQEDNIVQFIGDPYQTLDFEGEMPIVNSNKVFELNVCNRFGNQLARQLPYLVSDVNIICSDNTYSFNPVLLIYLRKERLIDNYKKHFTEYLKDQNFANDSRKDTILGIQNDTIDDFVKGTVNSIVASKMDKSKEPHTKQILFLVHEALISKIPAAGINNFKIADWLQEHPLYKNLKLSLIRSIKTQKLEVDNLVDYLNQLILEKGGGRLNKSNGVFTKIATLIKHANDIPKFEVTNRNNNLVFSTIHSVKGETHRSVLLLDSEKDLKPKIHTRLLKGYFCEWEEDFSEYWVERNLLYVAMSRPSHLFTFAMDRNFITDEEIELFKTKGWEAVFTEDDF